MANNQPADRIVRTDPDPTERTQEQIDKSVHILRDLLNVVEAKVDQRFNAMDKAIVLLQAFADRQPTTATVAQSVAALEKLFSEKFASVATQFQERDEQQAQTARDSKIAVDAAFAAAKEAVSEQNKSNATAVAKSEAAFTKQIDQLGTLINTFQQSLSEKIEAKTRALDDKIDDLKNRLTTSEGRSAGVGMSAGVVGGIISALAAVAVIVSVILTRKG